MLPVGFEPTISAGELPQTYALDRAATGTGNNNNTNTNTNNNSDNNSNSSDNNNEWESNVRHGQDIILQIVY